MKKIKKEKNVSKKKSKNNFIKKIIICLIVLLLAVGIGFFGYNKFFKEEPVEDKPLENSTVEELYDVVKTTKCTYIEDTSDKKMTQDSLLYVIFSKLHKDGKLKKEIAYNDYIAAAKSVIGSDQVIPTKFSNYDYDGYSYTLNKKKITRTVGTCGDKEYVSKLFGYSHNEDETELQVYIKVAYIKDGKLYDLNDKELGDYSEEEENSLLDLSTSKIYTYEKQGAEYKLKGITNGE